MLMDGQDTHGVSDVSPEPSPTPLVLGQRVFSWTAWDVVLREAVEYPGGAQVTFERLDEAPEMTFREPLLAYTVGQFLRVGTQYAIIGLGERAKSPNLFASELIYTCQLNGQFQWALLSQGLAGEFIEAGKGLGFTRSEQERRRQIFHYLRELYYWSCRRAARFASEEDRREGETQIRRLANEVAMKFAREMFGFNGKRFRDDL